MSLKRAEILCEDTQHFSFINRLFKELGVRCRLVVPMPGGRGSGEQHIRLHFCREVGAIRARRRKQRSDAWWLIVMLDADTTEVDAWIKRLDKLLHDAGMEPCTAGDGAVLLIPKRNIETWIRALDGVTDVNEIDAYPKLDRESDCWGAAKKLARQALESDSASHETLPPSLRRAITELRRLL